MSSYENVKRAKLSFKGGMEPTKKIEKKKKKKSKSKATEEEQPGEDAQTLTQAHQTYDIDTGIGHAPDGKKSKKYEELFPVETKKFGYQVEKEISREEALDARVKKKADRYCK